MARRFYFDVHVYDALLQSGRAAALRSIIRLVQSGRWHVYASVRTFEELAPLAEKNHSRYVSLMDLFWRIVRTNVLDDRARLIEREMEKSNRLSLSEACFSRQFVCERLRPARHNPELLRSLVTAAVQQKSAQSDSENLALDETSRKIEAAIRSRESSAQDDSENYADWLSGVRAPEVQSFIDALRADRGLPLIAPRRSPCLAAFVGYTLARVKRYLRDRKHFEPSAIIDRDHFSYAAVPGVLVTDDRDLTRSAALLELPLVEIRTPERVFADAISGAQSTEG